MIKQVNAYNNEMISLWDKIRKYEKYARYCLQITKTLRSKEYSIIEIKYHNKWAKLLRKWTNCKIKPRKRPEMHQVQNYDRAIKK